LLSHRLSCKPIELYLEPPPIDSKEILRFQADAAARASGVPLQYLLGSAEFYAREFSVGPGVFIPRPETEILVDVALEILKDRFPRVGRGSPLVVDVGTGCGAIAITLALERPGIRVAAVEISAQALHFARRNAFAHGASVAFFQGDLIHFLRPGSVDLLVANLPYLDSSLSHCWPKELHWEPWNSLDGGSGGLTRITALLFQARRVLKSRGIDSSGLSSGCLVLEVGQMQVDPLRELARIHSFEVGKVVRDLAGRDRVVILWKN